MIIIQHQVSQGQRSGRSGAVEKQSNTKIRWKGCRGKTEKGKTMPFSFPQQKNAKTRGKKIGQMFYFLWFSYIKNCLHPAWPEDFQTKLVEFYVKPQSSTMKK